MPKSDTSLLSNEATDVFEFGQSLTIYDVGGLVPGIGDFLKGTDTPCFDLSQVNEVDSAGVQLLLMIKATAESMSKTYRFTAVSEALREILLTFDLLPALLTTDERSGL